MFNASGWASVVWFPSQQETHLNPSVALTTVSTHMPRRIVLCSAAPQFNCSSVGQRRRRVGHNLLFISLFYSVFTWETNSWCHRRGELLSVRWWCVLSLFNYFAISKNSNSNSDFFLFFFYHSAIWCTIYFKFCAWIC